MLEPINVFVMGLLDYDYNVKDIHCMVQNHVPDEINPIQYTRGISFASNLTRTFCVQPEDIDYFFQHLLMHRIHVLKQYEGIIQLKLKELKKQLTPLQAAQRKKLSTSDLIKQKLVMAW